MIYRILHRYAIRLILIMGLLLQAHCTQERLEEKVRSSRLVVLILPQFDAPTGIKNSSQTPDSRHGFIDELTFWYEYSFYLKKEIEEEGYRCIIVNHGDIPNDTRLLPYAKLSDIVHLQSPSPESPTPSSYHSQFEAVGMASLNYAATLNPACIIFLRHHEYNPHEGWVPNQNSSIYCNTFGVTLASYIARSLNRRLMNNALPNRGKTCAITRRQDPTLRDAVLLNHCDLSYTPAVAPSITFLNNPDHVKFLTQHQNAIYFTECLARGIVNYLNARQ